MKTGDPRADRRAKIRHNFLGGLCPHPDCGGGIDETVTGGQCAECGHYFPPSRLRMDADSETRCRAGMGHEAPGAYRV